MVEEGKYTHLWMKYTAVIHLLLKKTDSDNQKLQLYKHEFEHSGHKQNTNFTFTIDIINGKTSNIVSSTGIAKDLWQVLTNNTVSKNWLKEHKVKISMGKSFELLLDKIPEE